jgi:hypothetical protein
MSAAQSNTDLFDRLRHWKDFRKTASHLFPTDDSLRWFMRSHEQALADAKAVLKLGRGTFIDGDRFRAVAVPLMKAVVQRSGS